MEWWQAAILALFCYLGALTTPWVFGTSGGWYVITRPLVAGLISGIVLGDVKTGVLIGIAVQLPFIALITPGGAVPSDLSFASYLGIPLAMVGGVTGANPSLAVSLAVGLGAIGVAAWNVLSVGNAAWAHVGDRFAEEGNLEGIIGINYWAQLGTFALRFILPFVVLLAGSAFAQDFVSFLTTKVPWLVQYLTILGGALPAVGIAILLLQIAPRVSLLVWFLLGWALFFYGHISVVAIAVVGLILAVLYYLYFSRIEALGEAQGG